MQSGMVRLLMLFLLACISYSCAKPVSVKPSADIARASRLDKINAYKFLRNQEMRFVDERQTRSINYTSLILNPSKVTFGLYHGWNREFQANNDNTSIAFISGPTFELLPRTDLGYTAHGDLKLSNGTWLSKNLAASVSRAHLCITPAGLPSFGFGALTQGRAKVCRIFIGGLHSLFNNSTSIPLTYKGVYGKMYMSDVRIIYGLRKDDLIEIIETHDGVSFADLNTFVRRKGFLAAYLPDHASKSRLIVPGVRLWSLQHAIWISGGRPSITQMPLMLRVSKLPAIDPDAK